MSSRALVTIRAWDDDGKTARPKFRLAASKNIRPIFKMPAFIVPAGAKPFFKKAKLTHIK
jgi:hypothetical protein